MNQEYHDKAEAAATEKIRKLESATEVLELSPGAFSASITGGTCYGMTKREAALYAALYEIYYSMELNQLIWSNTVKGSTNDVG